MSLAIAALTAPGESVVQDTDCIETSFPDFRASLLRITGQSLRPELQKRDAKP